MKKAMDNKEVASEILMKKNIYDPRVRKSPLNSRKGPSLDLFKASSTKTQTSTHVKPPKYQ